MRVLMVAAVGIGLITLIALISGGMVFPVNTSIDLDKGNIEQSANPVNVAVKHPCKQDSDHSHNHGLQEAKQKEWEQTLSEMFKGDPEKTPLETDPVKIEEQRKKINQAILKVFGDDIEKLPPEERAKVLAQLKK